MSLCASWKSSPACQGASKPCWSTRGLSFGRGNYWHASTRAKFANRWNRAMRRSNRRKRVPSAPKS
ncbi:MAG: hypothetical protein C4336_06320, partial [Armatimonadota bacterium]